jgi:hypothetical protein
MPGGVPVSHWQTGYYVPDSRRLTLPPDLPDGQYTLVLEVRTCQPTCETGEPVPFLVAEVDSAELIPQNRLVLPAVIQAGSG